MGEVYRARDTRLDRTVAIKILPTHLADDIEARQRFEREARTISSLNHPNICILHDVGNEDGAAYLVMEFVKARAWKRGFKEAPCRSSKRLNAGLRFATRSKRLTARASCIAI